jgi:hypothetical protein
VRVTACPLSFSESIVAGSRTSSGKIAERSGDGEVDVEGRGRWELVKGVVARPRYFLEDGVVFALNAASSSRKKSGEHFCMWWK